MPRADSLQVAPRQRTGNRATARGMTLLPFLVIWSYTHAMPRAFTDSERTAIRERLLAAGQDLFARRGIRATTVDQLARAAGISKGAYYAFYPSKEALFFAIVEDVETEMQARLEEQVAAAPDDALRLLVRASLRARLENPLFDVAISEEAVAVMRTMSPEEQAAFLRRDIDMTESIARPAGRVGSAGERLAGAARRTAPGHGVRRHASRGHRGRGGAGGRGLPGRALSAALSGGAGRAPEPGAARRRGKRSAS